MKAAERDGFAFADGAFRPAGAAPSSFAVTRLEDLASIDDLGRRLHLLADDRPKDAVAGATELLESACRTVMRLIGKPAPKKTAGLVDIAKSTLKTLGLEPLGLELLGALVATLGETRNVGNLSPRHARFASSLAVTFAAFVAETYVERVGSKKDRAG